MPSFRTPRPKGGSGSRKPVSSPRTRLFQTPSTEAFVSQLPPLPLPLPVPVQRYDDQEDASTSSSAKIHALYSVIVSEIRTAMLAQDCPQLYECAQHLLCSAELDLATIRQSVRAPSSSERFGLCFGFEERDTRWAERVPVERRTSLPVRPHREVDSDHSSATPKSQQRESKDEPSVLALGRLEWFYALPRHSNCLTFYIYDSAARQAVGDDDSEVDIPANMCTHCAEIYRERSGLTEKERTHPERGLSPSKLTAGELQDKLAAMRKVAQGLEKKIRKLEEEKVESSAESEEKDEDGK